MFKTVFMAVVSIFLFMMLNISETWIDGEQLTFVGIAFELGEAATIFGAVALASFSAMNLQKLHNERIDLIAKVEHARFEGAQWRQLADGYVKGLGAAITSQFDDWKFTESEAHIAMLILKGFSNREIASFRKTSEATVRQQASSIYAKSGLRNHRELSAYFLEDLTPAKNGFRELAEETPSFHN